MAAKKKDDRVYRAVLAGGSVVIRILLFVLCAVLLLAVGRVGYASGYTLFEKTEEGQPSETMERLRQLIAGLTGREP